MMKRPKPSDVRYAASVFKALSHPDRLRIVCGLAEDGPCTQTQLAERLELPQSTVARHVAPLRGLGLVTGERDGVEVPLLLSSSLTQDLLNAVCGWLHPGDLRERTFSQLMAVERETA